jgi:hypothetical protein
MTIETARPNLEAIRNNEAGRSHSVRKVYETTNRGAIWTNQRKREGKQDADFTGTLDVNGVTFWVNAWKPKAGSSERSPRLTFTIRQKVDADDEI